MFNLKGIFGGIVIAFFCLSQAAGAAEPVYEKPVYNPATKSYFELVRIRDGSYSQRGAPEINWAKAASAASKRIYKGVHGHLAIVKDIQTHAFLRDTFRPKYSVWIGLRYWCKRQALEWVTSEQHPASGFKAWRRPWTEDKFGCQPPYQYMGVAYSGVSEGFQWFAKASPKEYVGFFVEYPTGKQ